VIITQISSRKTEKDFYQSLHEANPNIDMRKRMNRLRIYMVGDSLHANRFVFAFAFAFTFAFWFECSFVPCLFVPKQTNKSKTKPVRTQLSFCVLFYYKYPHT